MFNELRAAAAEVGFVGLCYLVMSYGILYVFKSLEYRLSGHLRAGPTIKAAPAEEALAVR